MLTMEQDISNQIHFRNINIPVPVPPPCCPHYAHHICAHTFTHVYSPTQLHTHKYMHTEADTAHARRGPAQTQVQAVQVNQAHRQPEGTKDTPPRQSSWRHTRIPQMCTQGTRTQSDTHTPSTQAKAEAGAEQVVVLNRGHILSLPSPPGDIGNVCRYF